MAQPYIGEIRMFAGNFAPAGWMFCEGQLLPISENDTLFQLIGTTYGGDGQSTFALPDMRGRIPIHQGAGYILAETGGAESITLTVNQTPVHAHGVRATTNPGSPGYNATTGAVAATAGANVYALGTGVGTAMRANSIAATGGSQPHTNMAPYLCVNYIISLFGIFPSPT